LILDIFNPLLESLTRDDGGSAVVDEPETVGTLLFSIGLDPLAKRVRLLKTFGASLV